MKKIKIPYFPVGIKFTVPILIALSIYLFTIDYSIWACVLILLSVIVLTTEYVTEIDNEQMEYRDFLSFLWIPLNEEKRKFKQADKIVIRKEKHSQMLNSRASSRQHDWVSYTGTLIIDGNKELDLLTKTDKNELAKGLKEFSDYLQVDIEDQTTSQHFIL